MTGAFRGSNVAYSSMSDNAILLDIVRSGKARRLKTKCIAKSAVMRQPDGMTLILDPLAAVPSLPDPAPDWLTGSAGQDPDMARFYAGAGLAMLHALMLGRYSAVPLAVLAERQALAAAVSTLRMTGRREGLGALRDALHLRRPDEAPGPAGVVGQAWRQGLRELARGQGGRGDPDARLDPITRAAVALEAGLRDSGDPLPALMAAEQALACALRWLRMVPVITPGLVRADLRTTGPAMEAVIAWAIATQVPRILQTARDLGRRAERLRAIAPRLRSRGSDAALALFFTEDALAPTLALSPVVRGSAVRMSDRAARRLCERLVELGGLRELTGRSSFRLYGL